MGLREDDFWCLTPKQIAATVKDRAAVLAAEHDNRAWLAHTISALRRTKKLPKLQTLLSPRRHKPRPRQSWQEQLRVMDQWVAVTRNPDRLKKRH